MTLNNEEIQQVLNYRFKDTELLNQALTHKSFHFENLGVSTGDNERLEFVGDAVIDLVVAHLLMKADPDCAEGELSKKRAYLVSEAGLFAAASELGIARHIKLGKGEVSAGGATKPRIVASAFEALVGALFLDSGYDRCVQLLESLLASKVEDLSHLQAHDEKSRFQEFTQEKMRVTPSYRLLQEKGPDHEKQFEVAVMVRGEVVAVAWGKNKKAAEREAARLALQKWGENE